MRQLGLAVAVVTALASMSAVAAADEVPRRGSVQNPIVLERIDIAGKRQRPLAAVEVSRVRPQLGVRDLKRSLVDRIEAAATKDPF